MAKVTEMNFNYDEIEVGKNYFEFNENCRSFSCYLIFTKNTNQGILKYVLKYLLHVLKKTPYEVEEIIRKYMVLVTYYHLNKKAPNVITEVECLEELLKKPLSVHELTRTYAYGDSLIEKIFNKEKSGDYNKLIDKLAYSLPQEGKLQDAIKNFLKKDNYYFSLNGSIESLEKNSRSVDQLIAEALVDHTFTKFKIEIDMVYEEAFKQNFHESLKGIVFKDRVPLLFGLFIDDLIKNNNLYYFEPVNLASSDTYKIILRNKDANISCKGCVSYINCINEDFMIDKTKIVPFKFKLNDKEYTFDKNGIK